MKKFSFMKKILGLLLCFFTVSAGNFCAWSANDAQNANCKKLSFQSNDSEMGMITIYHIGQYPDEPDTSYIEGGWKEFCDSDSLYVVATPKEGYRLSQWSNGDTSNVIVTFGDELERNIRNIPAGDSLKTIAYFEPAKDTFCISIYAEDSNMGRTNDYFCGVAGQRIDKFAEGYTGYELDYWESIHGYSTDTIVGNDTLVAHFKREPIPCKNILFRSDNEEMGKVEVFYFGSIFMDSTLIRPNQIIICQGDSAYAVATAKEGYKFSRWSNKDTSKVVYTSSGQLEKEIQEISANDTLNVVAYFETDTLDNYLAVSSSNSQIGVVSGGGKFADSTIVQVYVSSRLCARFSHWSDGDTTNPRIWRKKGSDSLVAYFEEDATHLIVESADEEQGTVTAQIGTDTIENHYTVTWSETQTITLSAQAKAGYQFVEWNTGNKRPTIKIHSGCDTIRYTAYFEPAKDTFCISIYAEDSNMGRTNDYFCGIEGQKIEKLAEAYEGYEFDYWESIRGYSTDTIVGNDTLVAHFKKEPMPCKNIVFRSDEEEMGTVEVFSLGDIFMDSTHIQPNRLMICQGDSVYAVATPREGYIFSHWSNGDTSGVVHSYGGQLEKDVWEIAANDTLDVVAYFEEIGEMDSTANYLTFTADERGSSFGIVNIDNDPDIQYSINGGRTWRKLKEYDMIVLSNKGDKALLRGMNPEGFSKNNSSWKDEYTKFVMKGYISASGSVMSLLDRKGVSTTIPSNYCFASLFSDCVSLTEAPELPATTLRYNCYSYMFNGCENLVKAPELPAMKLENECYKMMFTGCTRLKQAPALPATQLGSECYYMMFSHCTSLTQAPVLPATKLTENCYWCMFEDCTSLTEAPELPATTLAYMCYCGMFGKCTSLTSAPELPVTALESECYRAMFNGCTKLKQAPTLPATKLAPGCYEFMFSDCTNLTSAPKLPATTIADECYLSMFQNCTSLTQTPELPATTLAKQCYANMFSGCTGIKEPPTLPNTVAPYCYQSMFTGCTGLTKAPELPATTLEEGCYTSMFWNCTGLTEAPELPATILAGKCYSHMFEGCTNLATAPELPVMELEEQCYANMFRNCTSLTQAPELPASELAKFCYSHMFEGCTGIKEPPTLPNVVAPYCYQSMFTGCTGLTKAPELPATTLEKGCYEEMFWGCTSLTQAPELPSHDVPWACYRGMFKECTNLRTTPVLLADSLESSYSYQNMFSGCQYVDKIEVSFTEWDNSTKDWLTDVAPTGTFICPKGLPIEYGTSRIPEGWDVVYKEETNGMEAPLSNNRFKVWTVDLTIHFLGTTKEVEVYGLNGKLVARKAAGDEAGSITMPQGGVYIVKSGTESIKVEL